MTPGSGSHRDAAADGLYTQNDCGPSRGSRQWRFRSAERFLHCEAIEILTGLKRLRHKAQDTRRKEAARHTEQGSEEGPGGRGLVMITALAALPSEKQKPRTAAETFTVTLCFTESV